MRVKTKKIRDMFDYLSSDDSGLLLKANGAFVFCRDDPLVARTVSDLMNKGLADYAMFTGGIGKDSGYLIDLSLPEAKWQAGLLNMVHGINKKNIYIEPTASNGGECCRFGIDTIIKNELPHKNLIIVCHPTSLRRVKSVLTYIAREEKNFDSDYQKIGTPYAFNPENPNDQKEAVAEMLRIADWPSRGWADKQDDLPIDLVEYSRHINKCWNSNHE